MKTYVRVIALALVLGGAWTAVAAHQDGDEAYGGTAWGPMMNGYGPMMQHGGYYGHGPMMQHHGYYGPGSMMQGPAYGPGAMMGQPWGGQAPTPGTQAQALKAPCDTD